MDVCPPEGIITLPEWRHLLMDCPPELCSLWGIFYPLCSCDSLIWRPLCSSSYSTENGLVEKKKVGIKMSFGEQSFLRKLRHPFQNIFKVFFLLLQFDLLWNNRFSLLIYFFFNLSLIVVEFKLKWYFFVVPKNFTLYLSLRKKKRLSLVHFTLCECKSILCLFPLCCSLEMCWAWSIILNSGWTLVPS